MTMITPSAQLTLTKGNKSWSSTAVAAALELVDPLGSGPWRSLTAAAFFFFLFFFFFFFALINYLSTHHSSTTCGHPPHHPEDSDFRCLEITFDKRSRCWSTVMPGRRVPRSSLSMDESPTLCNSEQTCVR
eukprot:FR737460.1.p2 GENE.FR737460.1~~FR737460.1.p2  ORF type:complete len:131 (-),score=29.51 FR737460.1:284-676(-)